MDTKEKMLVQGSNYADPESKETVTTETVTTVLNAIKSALLYKIGSGLPLFFKSADWMCFAARLDVNFPAFYTALFDIYGKEDDFFDFLLEAIESTLEFYLSRDHDLKEIDEMRSINPDWLIDHKMVAGSCYVDLFAGNILGLIDRIPYLKELGITYLYLLPIFKSPDDCNDGGFAISSYSEINPQLGTLNDLITLTRELHKNGISLALDLVLNHTADEHEWAKKALEGNEEYQNFYWFFDDENEVNEYLEQVGDVFPQAGAPIRYLKNYNRWVWCTFFDYQWDLNYKNKKVFLKMLEQIFSLANIGVDVLRLDAIPHVWKQKGTPCISQPEVHLLVKAYRALTNIVAPGITFKSETILCAEAVTQFVNIQECNIGYRPILPSLLWMSLATRNTEFLSHSIKKHQNLPPNCTWLNYIRTHDDLSWYFSIKDTWCLKDINHIIEDLSSFYRGDNILSFARGEAFQTNPKTGKSERNSGTTSSLAGLEIAIAEGNELNSYLAIKRITLLHSILFSIGGLPMLYLGDEVGVLNNYNYQQDPSKVNDSRWLHRIKKDWDKDLQATQDPKSPKYWIFFSIKRVIQLRKKHKCFEGNNLQVIFTECRSVFAYVRAFENEKILILTNFSEYQQEIPDFELLNHGFNFPMKDLITGKDIHLHNGYLILKEYQYLWLN